MRPRIPSAALEGLLYALAAFGPFAFGGVEPWSRAAIEILAVALALGVFLKGRPAASPAGSWFWLFPAAVAAYGCLQLTAVADPAGPHPLRPFTAAPHETRAAVLLWAAYAAVLYSVPRIITTPEAARRCVRFIFGVGAALAFLGLAQAALGGDKLYGLRYAPKVSSFGSYYNKDHAANVLLMAMAAGVGALIARGRNRRALESLPDGGRSSQIVFASSISVLFVAFCVCSSEAAFLAIPLASAATVFLGAGFASTDGGRRLRAGAAVAGAALAIFFAYYHVSLNADAGALIERSVMGRLSIYGDAARWWRDAPLFGTGLGSFATVYPAYQDLGLLGVVSHAHSDWIELLLDAGLAGLGAALLAASLGAFVCARTWLSARSSEMRALLGGVLWAAAAFAAHSLFEFSFQIPANAVLFFLAAGVALSAPSWADKAAPGPAAVPPPKGAALLAAAYALVLARAAYLPAAAAFRAAAPGEPVRRVVSLAEAAALDADPAYGAALSDFSYKASEAGEGARYPLLRLSLRYGLAAAESRPFSSDALFLAGAALWRLERPDDAAVFFRRAATVRFARYEGRRESAAERREKNLQTLKELKLR